MIAPLRLWYHLGVSHNQEAKTPGSVVDTICQLLEPEPVNPINPGESARKKR